jgi:outer membrane protein insertion porin family
MNNNINPNIGPDRQEPFTANRAYADVMAAVEEGPTAKFQLGVGASSFGGIYGQVGVTENNFNILAFPRSWDDIVQQRAFRGAGQQLSVELMPGTLVNVYSVSFRDPYLFDLPIGLGVSGYQFSRYYTDWHEVRSGGRFSLGKQFGIQSYGDVAFRIEDVNISGFKYPAPALLLDAAGHTTLATFRPSFRIDTRDSPFLPTSGTFAEVAFEQAVATYTFSKFTAEARQYFTTGSRPDGQGKRVLTLRSFFGVTSRDTPIYERFFAGNLNSIRGFQFRGVGPFILNVNTGGVFESLVSAEYRIPLTANEHFHQVFFIDTGTVENDYRISDYRVSVGTGLRVLIPQIFKQIPLAFDLAFPVSKGPQDRVQAFNFSIGAMW